MEITKPLPLEISDRDLEEQDRALLEKEILATRTLGDQEHANRKILDMLPKLIADRVKQIIPDDFELESLELKFDVQGKICGSGVGGEVVAKLKKRSS
jgi:hypothetical protein